MSLQGGLVLPLRERVFTILQACSESRDLSASRDLYSLVVKAGLDSVCVVGDHLIRLFASCSSLPEALYIFSHVQRPSLYSWNSIISVHVQLGQSQRALSLYCSMRIPPDQVTISNVLKASIDTGDVHTGRLAHSQIELQGIPLDLIVGSSLIDFYARLGTLEEACRVFHALPHRDVVSWGAMLAGFLQYGQFDTSLRYLGRMRQEGIQPNKVIFLLGLKACSSSGVLAHGMQINSELYTVGLEKDPSLQSALVEMYSRCGFLQEAESVFERADCKDLVLWSSIIGAYVRCLKNQPAVKLYTRMILDGLSPDKVVFLFLLQACGNAGHVLQGFQVHKDVTLRGLDKDLAVQNTLIRMYAKCGDLMQCHEIFHQMQFQDEVSWTAIITGYIDHGQYHHAVELFVRMQLEGFRPNTSVISCILISCGNLSALEEGRIIHEYVLKLSLDDDDHHINNALLYMYSRCNSLRETEFMFNRMGEKDMASWNSMISGYADHGHVQNVLNLLKAMQSEGFKPDEGILMCGLSACGIVGALQEGDWICHTVLSYGVDLDSRLACAIVQMYVDCGTLQDAQAAFDLVAERDVVLWSALIAGYCEHGQGSLAVRLVEGMLKAGVEPDEIAFLGLVQVCCELGSVHKARLLHSHIVGNGFDRCTAIHSSLLDMYIKCGSMEDAHLLFTKLTERDAVSWGSILSGNALLGNKLLVNQCLKDMSDEGLKPNTTIFTCIFRACSHAGLLEDGCQYFQDMRDYFGIEPSIEHYDCILDLFGRVGRVSDSTDLLQTAPSPCFLGCTSLLTSCRTYGDASST